MPEEQTDLMILLHDEIVPPRWNAPDGTRIPIYIHPTVRNEVRDYLLTVRAGGMSYSEFLHRSIGMWRRIEEWRDLVRPSVTDDPSLDPRLVEEVE